MSWHTVMNQLERVEEFIKEKHQGQVRRGSGEPYYHHPERVAATVSRYTDQPVMIMAALLHDTLEDTDTTEKDIEELSAPHGKEVLSLVKELTSFKDDPIYKEFGKAEYLARKMSRMSKSALLIKLADRLDNVSDLESNPKEWSTRYAKETEVILKRVCNEIGESIYSRASQELINLISSKIKPFLVD